MPITNARYALNAANARWGSLYDGFYGTDAMGTRPRRQGATTRGRGARVIARARVFLDEAFPVEGGSHADARRYHVESGALLVDDMPLMQTRRSSSAIAAIPRRPRRCCWATTGCMSSWSSTAPTRSAARDQAGLADVRIESAVSAIMDCEDSVACVDARGQGAGLCATGWG